MTGLSWYFLYTYSWAYVEWGRGAQKEKLDHACTQPTQKLRLNTHKHTNKGLKHEISSLNHLYSLGILPKLWPLQCVPRMSETGKNYFQLIHLTKTCSNFTGYAPHRIDIQDIPDFLHMLEQCSPEIAQTGWGFSPCTSCLKTATNHISEPKLFPTLGTLCTRLVVLVLDNPSGSVPCNGVRKRHEILKHLSSPWKCSLGHTSPAKRNHENTHLARVQITEKQWQAK